MRAGLAVLAMLIMTATYGCSDERRLIVTPERVLTAKVAASKGILTAFSISNSRSLGLRGDGKYLDASGQSTYANGICGVSSRIFVDNGGGDAIMYTNDTKYRDTKCADYPRTVFVGAETNARVAVQFFIEALHQPGAEIAIGDSLDRYATISPASGPCLRYSFAINAGGDRLVAKRADAGTWLVHTKPAPNNRAVCMDDGRVFAMDVELTVHAQ